MDATKHTLPKCGHALSLVVVREFTSGSGEEKREIIARYSQTATGEATAHSTLKWCRETYAAETFRLYQTSPHSNSVRLID